MEIAQMSAKKQQELQWYDELTEEETEIFKRGRNATGNNVPRSSNPKDYRRATGMEALFGYLYLTGQNDRIKELFEKIYTSERT